MDYLLAQTPVKYKLVFVGPWKIYFQYPLYGRKWNGLNSKRQLFLRLTYLEAKKIVQMLIKKEKQITLGFLFFPQFELYLYSPENHDQGMSLQILLERNSEDYPSYIVRVLNCLLNNLLHFSKPNQHQ